MLENLRRIAWSAYSHAYGPADDVPDQIELLQSIHPRDWVPALDVLFWTIYHQGNVYDSTALAVPFLIELLACSQIKCRGRIMELLAHIATAQSCLEFEGRLWGEGDGISRCVDPDDTAELDDDFDGDLDELQQQREWSQAARKAVWKGWRTYLSLGADLDKRVRICSPYLLGQLAILPVEEDPEAPDRLELARVVPAAMAGRVETEPNSLVVASLLFGIEAWLPHAPKYAEVIRRHFHCRASEPASRLAAALCICCLPADCSDATLARDAEAATELIIDALEEIDECAGWFEPDELGIECKYSKHTLPIGGPCDDEYGEPLDGQQDVGADEDFALPWMEEGLAQEILDRLAITSAPTPPRLPAVLMDQLASANQYTLENYSEAVHRFIMCERTLSCASEREDLSPQQTEVVRLLFHDASFWATNVGNVELAFNAMGIPYCRSTLASWLGQSAEVTCERDAALMLEQIVRAELPAWLPDEGDVVDEDVVRRRLDTLVLTHIGSDAFMPLLSQFPSLQVLEIGPYTTDRGVAQLPCLPLLDLTLDERITDVGMGELLRFPNLRSLNTFGAQLTDLGLEVIGRLPLLRSLYLSGNLTLAGLHALLPLKELAELSLPTMSLSLAVIPILQQLPSLTTLSLNGKCLDEEQRRRLKLELPACQIWFGQHGC